MASNMETTSNDYPIIQVSGKEPVVSLLSMDQLNIIFPKLRKYITNFNPLRVVLPEGSTTETGLLSTLDWMFSRLISETAPFPVDLPTMLEIYHTCAYLGMRRDSKLMRNFKGMISFHINEKVTQTEMHKIWHLREFKTLDPFVLQMAVRVVNIKLHFDAFLDRPDVGALLLQPGVVERFKAVTQLLGWVGAEPELQNLITDIIDGKMPESLVKAVPNAQSLVKKKWVPWTAIGNFEPILEVVHEAEEDQYSSEELGLEFYPPLTTNVISEEAEMGGYIMNSFD